MRYFLNGLCLFLLSGVTLIWAQNEEPRELSDELQEKKAEMVRKNVEILDLKSAITIHQSEIQSLQAEMESIKAQNDSLADSLDAKEGEIKQLKEIIKILKEDKKLSREMVKTIREARPSTDSVQSREVYPISDADFRALYTRALNCYFGRNYECGIDTFTYLLSLTADHPLSDNCQYWLGECYYSLEDYARAIAVFEQVPGMGDQNKAAAALFKIGMSYLKMGDRLKAGQAFERLEADYPQSKLVEKAQEFNLGKQKF